MSSVGEDFIRRIMERSVSDDEFSKKMSQLDSASQHELRALKAMVTETELMTVPSDKSKNEAWESILSEIDTDESVTKVVSIFSTQRMVLSGIAASLLLLAVFYYAFMTDHLINIEVQRGEISSIKLPDGSNLIVNAQSKVIYDKRGWKKRRKVKLEGEAHFDVEKGSGFEVETSKGLVQVLGTSFDVFNRGDNFDVSCYEGEVRVALINSKNWITLKEGEATSLKNGNLIPPKNFDQRMQKGWLKGEFFFDTELLSEVFNEFERQFDVRIDVGNIEGRVYTGHYKKGNMIEALDLICTPMGLSYEIMDDVTIHIY